MERFESTLDGRPLVAHVTHRSSTILLPTLGPDVWPLDDFMGASNCRGTILGVLIVRTQVFWGLYRGPHI